MVLQVYRLTIKVQDTHQQYLIFHKNGEDKTAVIINADLGSRRFLCAVGEPQLSAGCGALHLRSPTGGFAKGIPLNAVTRGSAAGMPLTMPFSVFTTLSILLLPFIAQLLSLI